MVRDPLGAEEAPEVQAVLDALHDQDCRTIVNHLEEPMSAQELASTTEIPQSTAYRKLDKLTEATILDERTEIRSDGHHTTRYVIDVEEVRFPLSEDLAFGVELDRPARTPDERLADMWSEVRKET